MSNHWVLRNYVGAPKRVRLHIGGRWRLFPFSKLEQFLPSDGSFIDVGCGYGQWPLFMGYLRPQAEVFGYDPDVKKIEQGREAINYSGLGNVHLSFGHGSGIPWKSCTLITIIDVFYLIPFDDQKKLLREAFRYLQPGGRLLLKDMGKKPSWKFAWNWLEEWLAVKVMKITIGNKFFFRSKSEWEQLLRNIGFSVSVNQLDRGYLHPHILFVGDKP